MTAPRPSIVLSFFATVFLTLVGQWLEIGERQHLEQVEIEAILAANNAIGQRVLDSMTAARQPSYEIRPSINFGTTSTVPRLISSGAASAFDIGPQTSLAWSSNPTLSAPQRAIEFPCPSSTSTTGIYSSNCFQDGDRLIFTGPVDLWEHYKICRRDDAGEWCKTFTEVFWP